MALLALGTAASAAATPRGALDLLRPGSHAAVGVGGDPFLSPLADDVGWWSDLHLGEAPGSHAEIETSRPAGFGSGTGVEGGQARWSATASGRFARARWIGGAGVDAPRWSGTWEGEPGALSFRSTGGRASAGLRLGLHPSLDWQISGASGSATSPRSTLGAGIRWRLPSGSSIQSSWVRTRRSDELGSTLYGEPLQVTTNLCQESQRLETRWRGPWRLELEGALERSRFLPGEPARAEARYHLDPSGSGRFDQVGLAWNRARRRALLRWTSVGLDLAGDLSWWGQNFGGVDRARLDLQSWLAAMESRSAGGSRTLLELEHVEVDARVRGDLESWPFTSTLVDLLGARRIVRISGDAVWDRWHVAHDRPWGTRTRVRGGLEWIEARPRARLESWQPAFLVFGKVDDRSDALALRRAQLAVLSIGAARPVLGLELDLGLEQCVFARVRERESASSSGAGGAEPAAEWEGDRHGIGTRVRFTASRSF
jgi:hypothetical protein